MKKPTLDSRHVLALLILAGGVAIVIDGRPNGEDGTIVKDASSSPKVSLPAKAQRHSEHHTPSTEAVTIAGESYALALDSYVLKAEDGREIRHALEPRATRATLAARLQALHPLGRAFPILYPADAARDPGTRRLLTSAITIQLPPGASAQQVARDTGLVLTDVPDYAPGFAIYQAANPLAALEISERWAATGTLPLVEVQLAEQRELRSLPNDALFAKQWHLAYQNQTMTLAGSDINVAPVWNYSGSGIRGAGVRIGIIDDGLEVTHEDLRDNVDLENDYDWNGQDNDPTPVSRNRHGTACAGVAGARGNNGIGVAGVAPEATLVGLRLIAGSTTDQMEAEAMAHLNDRIAIKSNSWGPNDRIPTLKGPGPLTRAAWQQAVTTGRQGKGTIFVWAGGNGLERKEDSNKDGYANSIYTIAVGAVDSRVRQAYYSEPGANLVCVAPSDGRRADTQGISTTDLTGPIGYASGNYGSTFGGTSSACPTVAGVVALMLEKNQDLGWRDVQEILIRSSTRIQPTNSGWSTNGAGLSFHHQFGAGLVNAAAAVQTATSWQNLPTPAEPVILRQSTLSPIPDNSLPGVTRTFAVDAALRVEHVTVSVNIRHARRGQLAITLTSPSGMVSQLVGVHPDNRPDYANWTFSTVRHWGESAQGNWTLHVRDGARKTIGSLQMVELSLYGTATAP
jgi:subtilisin family serine protease